MCLEQTSNPISTVTCAVVQIKRCKMWFCETKQIPATSNTLLKVFWGGLKGAPVYDTSDTLWAFTNLSCVFYRAFLREIQTQLHTNKWAMWFESSSVKWLQFTPFLPVQVLKWRELTWQVYGRLWLLTGRTVNVQSCIVFVKECVDCKGIYLQSHSTVGIILDENKPVWGGFQQCI